MGNRTPEECERRWNELLGGQIEHLPTRPMGHVRLLPPTSHRPNSRSHPEQWRTITRPAVPPQAAIQSKPAGRAAVPVQIPRRPHGRPGIDPALIHRSSARHSMLGANLSQCRRIASTRRSTVRREHVSSLGNFGIRESLHSQTGDLSQRRIVELLEQ